MTSNRRAKHQIFTYFNNSVLLTDGMYEGRTPVDETTLYRFWQPDGFEFYIYVLPHGSDSNQIMLFGKGEVFLETLHQEGVTYEEHELAEHSFEHPTSSYLVLKGKLKNGRLLENRGTYLDRAITGLMTKEPGKGKAAKFFDVPIGSHEFPSLEKMHEVEVTLDWSSEDENGKTPERVKSYLNKQSKKENMQGVLGCLLLLIIIAFFIYMFFFND